MPHSPPHVATPQQLSGKYAKATEVPVAGAARRGTLIDYACIHILTTSALQRLQDAYPEGQFSVQLLSFSTGPEQQAIDEPFVLLHQGR